MKKMHGFVDPISLGFLLSAVLASGATVSNKHHNDEDHAKNTQVEVVQQAVVKKDVKSTQKQNTEFQFPFE